MSFCTARNWALSEHSEGSGDTWTSQADGKNPLLLVSEIWFQSLSEATGDFSHSFLQGKNIINGSRLSTASWPKFPNQLAEVEPGQCRHTCEMKVLLLLWLSDILTQEQKCLGSKPAMCLLSVHLLSTKEGLSQAWSSFCLGQQLIITLQQLLFLFFVVAN